MERKTIAEVIPLNAYLNKGFHYLIPSSLEKYAEIGKRVNIFFRNRRNSGIIVNIINQTDVKNLKEIEEILDPIPILSQEILNLTDWISKYYLCPKGAVMKYIIPSQVSRKKMSSLLDHSIDEGRCGIEKEELSLKGKELLSKKDSYQFLLFDNHLLEYSHLTKPLLFHYHCYRLRDRYYIQCIDKILKLNKQILILIPEQRSCEKLKKKLTKKYGKALGIFDKKVSHTQKYLRFLHVQRGDIRIVIGTRSNVFLPFENLGLIIVEQENSLLYKEERIPRYNAREVALARGKLGGFKVILASFAPSIESYWKRINHQYIFKTDKRFSQYQQCLPEIEIINMEEEKSFQRIISFPLQQKILQSLKNHNKIILFLNRRGFAGYLICSQCGHVMRCPDCIHLLSYHIEDNAQWIVCHFCGKKMGMEKYCPKCSKGKIKPWGVGTQYVETLVRRMFPRARIQRFDMDITPKKNVQKRIMNEFNYGKIDILIGTQLLFSGLNYQTVDLLGIILADQLLNRPDYRSAESSFQFIYQIALNMSERKEPKSIYIQTYQPEHHCFQAIKRFNDSLFYQKEMTIRNELEYPPLASIIRLDFLGGKRELIKKSVFHFIDYAHRTGLLSKDELSHQLNKDSLMIVKEKDKNKASYVLRLNEQNLGIAHFKERVLQYILKYQSNSVKLMIDVEPIKMV